MRKVRLWQKNTLIINVVIHNVEIEVRSSKVRDSTSYLLYSHLLITADVCLKKSFHY